MKLIRTLRRVRRRKPEGCAAVLVAAGSSTRMGGVNKLMAPLGGMTVLERTALALENCSLIQELVVVTRPEQMEKVSLLLRARGIKKLTAVVPGGSTRTESVEAGLNRLSGETRLVAIHDGARPLVSGRILIETITKAAQTGAAAPAIPVKDTIKIAEDGIVVATPDRSRLFAVQTPQVFDYDLLRAALVKAKRDGIALTDDCAAAEYLGLPVCLTCGEEANLKITTLFDLRVAKLLLEEQNENRSRL